MKEVVGVLKLIEAFVVLNIAKVHVIYFYQFLTCLI